MDPPAETTPDQRVALCLISSPEHVWPGHPEQPERLEQLACALETFPGLWLESAEVPDAVLEAVHQPSYLEHLQRAAETAPGFLDPDTYITQDSFQAALAAVGGCLAVLQAVLQGRTPHGFALIRPPGHHASAARAMGFCLLNNVAIAARRCQQMGRERIMIVDFDVHHGNGTQEIFEDDPSVLYLSTHQRGIYPGTGAAEERGRGAGQGTTVNIPLPAGAGDGAFRQVAQAIIRPIAERFRPEMLMVSAGFDAHWRDPLAGLQLTCTGYYQLASSLIALADEHCGGQILFVLEGGYDPEVLSASVLATLHAMLGEGPPPDTIGPAPRPEPDITSVLTLAARRHSLS